jgi:putative addiction module component (TIGR02574 family)
MTQETNDLLKKALALPDEDRAVLAGVLIDSLDPSTESSAEEAWNQEIARRVEELDSGKAKTIPWDEVRHRIEAISKSRR